MNYNPISMAALDPKDRLAFRRALLRWYDANRRDLPWRRTRDPYRIWISEIMLQQTRVAVVVDRYRRFLSRFPSVQALACAQEDSVVAEWSGLGYYRRARNLHASAQKIVRGCCGNFPRSAEELRTLPGIGRYTAAAIASIAFDEPIAVVDGNVERVVRRVLKAQISGESVWCAAQDLLDPNRPGDFNQAMMELGATICAPTQPRCAACPVRKFCATRGRDASKRRKPRQQNGEIAYLLAKRDDAVLLALRPDSQSLMPGMWELPGVRLPHTGNHRTLFSLRHSITVTNYRVHVFAATGVRGLRTSRWKTRWTYTAQLSELPLTGLAAKILRRAGVV